jgi:RNA polymerase sigma factor (sigma-70 family)
MTEKEFTYKLVSLEDNLKRFAYSLTYDREAANDLVQETYLKALTNREKFVQNDNFKAWAFTILRNTFINEYRKNSKRRVNQDEEQKNLTMNMTRSNSSDSPETRIAVKELMYSINQLDEDFRTPLKMFYEGYKYKEIAEKLNMNIGTVKSKIFFSRKKLEGMISEYKAA